jgi:hypothetical protein
VWTIEVEIGTSVCFLVHLKPLQQLQNLQT